LGNYPKLPSGAALKDYWISKLGNTGASRILQALWQFRKPMTADAVAQIAQVSATSGSFATWISTLRALELIDGTRSALRASEELY
jgi:hypothetical protein